MKLILQIAKVAPHGRVYIGQKTMELLKLNVGDHVQIIDEGDGIKIAKVEA